MELLDLLPELLTTLFKQLELSTSSTLSQTCKTLNDIFHSDFVWHHYFNRTYQHVYPLRYDHWEIQYKRFCSWDPDYLGTNVEIHRDATVFLPRDRIALGRKICDGEIHYFELSYLDEDRHLGPRLGLGFPGMVLDDDLWCVGYGLVCSTGEVYDKGSLVFINRDFTMETYDRVGFYVDMVRRVCYLYRNKEFLGVLWTVLPDTLFIAGCCGVGTNIIKGHFEVSLPELPDEETLETAFAVKQKSQSQRRNSY
eukprot:TRINITY_DN7241_c0_g1_i1.p1 TRINITY_DN7241_c0_g1~~TRINITY_DN7241_c0_g1_i1.p1  ORF type:complete len:253 (+),score=45.33 TRINITY_DN7241_c0_g1_i1:395-1153(+)